MMVRRVLVAGSSRQARKMGGFNRRDRSTVLILTIDDALDRLARIGVPTLLETAGTPSPRLVKYVCELLERSGGYVFAGDFEAGN